jgi:hypothetical protein
LAERAVADFLAENKHIYQKKSKTDKHASFMQSVISNSYLLACSRHWTSAIAALKFKYLNE